VHVELKMKSQVVKVWG